MIKVCKFYFRVWWYKFYERFTGQLMLDQEGYRPNVGIVLIQPNQLKNMAGEMNTSAVTPVSEAKLSTAKVFWARRVGGQDAWQFPQGGINDGESPEAAVMRELHEEIGVAEHAVKVLGQTSGWLKYDLPAHMRRNNSTPGFVGQKQKWFLLELLESGASVQMDTTNKPEFDDFQWVSYYYPITQVVDFKREVYRSALIELAQFLPRNQ
jgi:putative (di)nucleoside polyphosphate hydrolase